MILSAAHFFSGVSAVAASALVASIWEAAVLVLAVALALRLLPGLTAAVRTRLWMFVLVIILLMPAFWLLITAHSGSDATPAALQMDRRWGLALATLWAALSLVRLSQLVYGAYSLRAIARRAVPIEPGLGVAALLRAGMQPVALCRSSEVNRPSAAGFGMPRILLPSALLQRLTEQELRQVVLHEMEHLRRRDQWSNLLQKLALAAFPLNPALLWLDKQLCFEREIACDDGVLRSTQARKAYAACLVNLADQSLLQRGVALALRAWERPSELARRVERVLHPQRDPLGVTRSRWVTAGLMTGVVGGAVMLAGAPFPVSFASAPSSVAGTAIPMAANSFRDSGGLGHPTLVKAVMPVRRKVSAFAIRPANQRPGKATFRKFYSHRKRVTHTPSARIVINSRQTVASRERLTLAITLTGFLPSYAAVPTRNGWLVFQL